MIPNVYDTCIMLSILTELHKYKVILTRGSCSRGSFHPRLYKGDIRGHARNCSSLGKQSPLPHSSMEITRLLFTKHLSKSLQLCSKLRTTKRSSNNQGALAEAHPSCWLAGHAKPKQTILIWE